MPREIKLRVWARAWKPPRFIGLDQLQISGQKTAQDVLDDISTINFILQQSVGLKDKNDIDIYEGDIIIHDACGKYYVFYDDESCSYQLRSRYDKLPMGNGAQALYSVIGNVATLPNELLSDLMEV